MCLIDSRSTCPVSQRLSTSSENWESMSRSQTQGESKDQQPSQCEPQAEQAAHDSLGDLGDHTRGEGVTCWLGWAPDKTPAKELRELHKVAGAELLFLFTALGWEIQPPQVNKSISINGPVLGSRGDSKAALQGWVEAKCWNTAFHLQAGICKRGFSP